MQSMGNSLNLRVRSSIINTKDLKELMLVYIDLRITVMLAQHNISIKIPEQVAFFQVWKPGLLAKGRHIQPVTGDQFPVQPLAVFHKRFRVFFFCKIQIPVKKSRLSRKNVCNSEIRFWLIS